ncbi:MAG TPA: hypothetical protein PK358_08695 [Spirochaetota bacterium]|nr:hypothetical protein [Spirochaetota bacterium]HPJ34896.1 hypothetical protein [Spirochaetota bacterium]
MKLSAKRKYLIIPLALISMALARSATDTVVFSEFPERCLQNVTKKRLPDGTSAYSVSNINYAATATSFTTDLLINFDRGPLSYYKDDSGKYEIYSADYNFTDGDGIGKGCASFYKSGHGMYINTSRGLWLGSAGDLGSFNIELRFKPSRTSGGILFSRTGYFSGVKKGIEIIIRNGRTTAYLHNMFRSADGRLKSAVLSRGDVVKKGEWHHFSLSFDRMSGRLAKYTDGDEDCVKYMTSTDSPEGAVDMPLFGQIDEKDESVKGTDLPLAVIGKNYSGFIDELRISYADFETLKRKGDIALNSYRGVSLAGRTPYNREGVITGEVGKFPTTGTSITDFSWDDRGEKGTFIWMEMRTSDRTFGPMDRTLRWYRVTKGQKGIYRAKGENSGFLRGRYYQWRAHLVASPEGGKSPLLKKVVIQYRPDPPPDVPMFVEAAESGDRYVLLKWKKNVEHDILGYRIYYGTRKGVYDGIISTVKGRRITNELAVGNYISVKIDNQLIEESMRGDGRGVLTFPALENTVLYYFAVTAYDSYKPDTPYNHESGLSEYVTARPFGGSEIR